MRWIARRCGWGAPRGGRESTKSLLARAARRRGGDEVGEEADKLAARVPGGGPPLDMAGADLERGVQRERPVPEVLEAMPLGPARREWQNGIAPIQRLNRRLLLHAEHRGVRRGGADGS